MTVSIREIASNASEASKVATAAVDVAANTSATIKKLGDSSAEIGRGHQGHHVDRPADEPARPQRDDRGGPRR
jgi:hypothetical protein